MHLQNLNFFVQILGCTSNFIDLSFFYLCSCLSIQFLYRTAVKATFNVKDNINDIIKNKKYSGDFKVSVVKYMYDNKLSLVATAVYFSIPDHTIVRDWKKIYDDKGPLYLLQEQRGRTKKNKVKSKKEKKIKEKNNLSEKELLKKIEYLETENAYLKKLNALIQEKENSKKKIK